jgi:hypothetical protein
MTMIFENRSFNLNYSTSLEERRNANKWHTDLEFLFGLSEKLNPSPIHVMSIRSTGNGLSKWAIEEISSVSLNKVCWFTMQTNAIIDGLVALCAQQTRIVLGYRTFQCFCDCCDLVSLFKSVEWVKEKIILLTHTTRLVSGGELLINHRRAE